MESINILISVIITTYRRPLTLERAIKSVLFQRGVDRLMIEVIVVDDNNLGDKYRIETECLMSRFFDNRSIKYIKHEKNRNGAAARNTGLRAAKGEYVTFLDDDDIFMPDRVRLLVDTLRSAPEYQAVYSGFAYARNGEVVGVKDAQHSGDMVMDLLCQKSFFGTGSNFICRTDSVRSVGGFDERFERHQDIEFMIRFLKKFEMTSVDDVLVVKSIDSTINRPNAQRMEHVKKMFLEEFSDTIEKYTAEQQRDIYRANLVELAQVVSWSGEQPSVWLKKNITRYGGLMLRDRIMVVLKRIQSKGPLFDDIRYYFAKRLFDRKKRSVADEVNRLFIELDSNE